MEETINIINYCEKTEEYLKSISLEGFKENYQKAKEKYQIESAIKVINTSVNYL